MSQIHEVLKDSLLLVSEIEPILEKQAACATKAKLAVDVLIRQGLLPFEKRAEMISALADPEKTLDYLVKMAERIGPEVFGEISDQYDPEAGMNADDKLKNWILS